MDNKQYNYYQMNNIIKTINLIPEDNASQITISFINKSSSNSKYGTYTMDQEIFHQLLRRMIAKFKQKYVEKRYRLYRWRNIYMTIDNNRTTKCYLKRNINNYFNGNIMLSVDTVTETDNDSIPKLNEYHSVVQCKVREITLNDDNPINIQFIEEQNNGNIINYIEIFCKNLNKDCKDIRKIIYDIISIIIS